MNKIKLLLVSAAALCISAAASAQTLTDVQTKYNEAVALIQSKKYDKAIPVLESVIDMGLTVGVDATATVDQAQKFLPDCLLRYGAALCGKGMFEEGLANLNQASELGELYNPDVARKSREYISQAYMMMGDKARKAEDYATAIDMFSKGYEAAPTNTKLALLLAESYAESGDLDNGLKIYREVAALESRHSRYKEAADTAKDQIVYYVTLNAKELADKGRLADAYTMLGNLLADDAGNADIHLIRIQTATNASQWNRVIEWGEDAAAAQTTPERKSDIYFYLGAAYQNSDNAPVAIATYEKVTAGARVAEAKKQIELLKNPPKK